MARITVKPTVLGSNGVEYNRRDFLRCAGTGTVATIATGAVASRGLADEAAAAKGTPESVVKHLYESLSESQRKAVCFPWDHVDEKRGLLRTRIANNWQITAQNLQGDFYTADQQQMVRDIFEGIIQPEWHQRFDKQLQDDAGGWGKAQSIAIFGEPGERDFEFVLTGRHMTMRCDGNSSDHVAFGGPIFYGHAADGFNEGPSHPGNVFWHQAVAANEVYDMLDERQRTQALVGERPQESHVGFRGKDGDFLGIAASELSSDQHDHLQKMLKVLIEPYRQSDRDEVTACLKAQGGLKSCHLAFYKDGDIGNDKVWDNWRLEGPSFVWYFRGEPHVHVWVNVADDPSVKLNA